MHKPIQNGYRGIIAFIGIIAILFTVAHGDYANGADFRSEDELVDETRANVEKHLNDKWQASSPAIKEKSVPEAPKIIKEEPAPVVEDKPATIETPPIAEETPAVVEDPPPVAKPIDKSSGFRPEQPVVSEAEPSRGIKKEETPSDVTQIDPEGNYETKSDKEAVGEDVELVKGIQEPVQVKPLVEPILKKMDVSKIGASPYYETYEGLRLLKYFTVAQRVEIYQEARPIDAYILDVFSMRYQNWPHTPWNIDSDYRTQLRPIFTRAYGTEITMSNPKNKEGQIRYTHDYREIYNNYYPKWPQIKREMWDQNEVLFMHSKQIDPIGWNYTSNLGYRYSTMSDKEDPTDIYNSYYEIRQTYFGSLSLAPNEKLE